MQWKLTSTDYAYIHCKEEPREENQQYSDSSPDDVGLKTLDLLVLDLLLWLERDVPTNMDTFLVEGRVRQVSDELCVVLSIDEALGREGVSEHVKEGGKGTDQEGSKEMLEYLAPRSPVPHLVKG